MQEFAYAAARTSAPAIHRHLALHRLQAEQRGETHLAALPTDDSIGQLIDTAFWASLRREEGIAPRISFAFLTPHETDHPLLFDQPLPLDPAVLARVGPAVERPGIHLGVAETSEGLRVWVKPMWDLTVLDLGAPHEVADPGIGVKRFPACASTHQSLDAVLDLVQEHAIDPANVRAVECAVSYLAPHQLIYDRADTGLQGKFSMPYCVSVALLDRTVGLAQFVDERVRRADVQSLMPKVRMIVHPEQTTRETLASKFSEVTITLDDGRALVRRVVHAKGQPRNPLTDVELDVKFRDAAGRTLPADRVESLLSALKTLDTQPDVGALCRQLTV